MGAVERLLSSQVLGFQAPAVPELIAGRADADQSLSEVEDSSSDKCGRRDLNPGVCSDCSNYQRGRPAYPKGLMSWTRLSSL